MLGLRESTLLRSSRRTGSNTAQRIRWFPLYDLRLDLLVAELDQPGDRTAAIILLVLAHAPPLRQMRERATLHHPLQTDRSQLGVYRPWIAKSAAEAIGVEDLTRIGEAQPLRLCSEWGAPRQRSDEQGHGECEVSEAPTRMQQRHPYPAYSRYPARPRPSLAWHLAMFHA